MNFDDVFGLTMSPVELMVRGTVMFWFLFLIFRCILRRDAGSIGISDFLFVVILGDAAQNAMIGSGTSTTDGMVLISTLVAWNYLVDYLAYRIPALERLLVPRRIALVSQGKMIRRNMRREFITTNELMTKVRESGLENISEVKIAYLEADGELSIIKN